MSKPRTVEQVVEELMEVYPDEPFNKENVLTALVKAWDDASNGSALGHYRSFMEFLGIPEYEYDWPFLYRDREMYPNQDIV